MSSSINTFPHSEQTWLIQHVMRQSSGLPSAHESMTWPSLLLWGYHWSQMFDFELPRAQGAYDGSFTVSPCQESQHQLLVELNDSWIKKPDSHSFPGSQFSKLLKSKHFWMMSFAGVSARPQGQPEHPAPLQGVLDQTGLWRIGFDKHDHCKTTFGLKSELWKWGEMCAKMIRTRMAETNQCNRGLRGGQQVLIFWLDEFSVGTTILQLTEAVAEWLCLKHK